MLVHKKTEGFNVKDPVITIGMFDGIHEGHKKIFNELKKQSETIHGESVVLSFWPHPRMIFEGNSSVSLLSTVNEKVKLLEKVGIDHFIILPFNREFANISYKSFIKDILVKQIHIHTIIIGYDHQFGKNREGNYEKLIALSDKYHFKVNKLDPQLVENEKVSSSIIRKSLQEGHIEIANKFLGYTYNFTGYVVEGKRNGRSIGFPTANLFIDESYKLIPGTGVYAVKVYMDNNIFNGMMNIGYRPTIIENNKQKTIEVHLFDIDYDLYGKEMTIEVFKKTRNETKFASVADLTSQLKKDEYYIRQFLLKK